MRRQRQRERTVDLDEVLLDASNMPSFDTARLEGKRELPITRGNVRVIGLLFLVVAALFLGRIYTLQIVNGDEYRAIAASNSVDRATIIAERGVVYDRTGELLAWNEVDAGDAYDFPVRAYTDRKGLGQILGYVSYPQRDDQGFFFRTEYVGRTGVEAAFDERLRGENGGKIVVTDALGTPVSEHAVEPSQPGDPLTLSIDAGLSEAFHDIIATSTAQAELPERSWRYHGCTHGRADRTDELSVLRSGGDGRR